MTCPSRSLPRTNSSWRYEPTPSTPVRHDSSNNRDVILLSGRKEKHRRQTSQWLEDHVITFYSHLHMRPDDDRKDVIVKEEQYNEHISGKYNVLMVIDDRLQVCRLWHRLGLPLFRVGDPDADF